MRIAIVGAGLAGSTAAAVLGEAGHDVVVFEATGHPGGMAADPHGVQEGGPHVFHTDNADVWAFANRFADMQTVRHAVVALQPPGPVEVPRREDPVFSEYTAKAWGGAWQELPATVRDRVPMLCSDGRDGYFAHRWVAQPWGGYTKWCEAMLATATVELYKTWPQDAAPATQDFDRGIWTGRLDHVAGGGFLPWAGRRFTFSPGTLPHPVINYCRADIPQIRSWDCAKIHKGHGANVVGSEFYSDHDRDACYPWPRQDIANRVANMRTEAQAHGWILCGRMATYQYLDMDQVVAQTIATIKTEGLA